MVQVRPEVPFIRQTGDRSRLDTIAWLPTRNAVVQVGSEDSGVRGIIRNPFIDVPLVVPWPGGDGIFIVERPTPRSANDSTVTLVGINVEGDATSVGHLRLPPISLSGSEATKQLERLAGANSTPPELQPSAWRDMVRKAVRAPAFQVPVTNAVAVSPDAIWLRTTVLARGQAEWLLVSARGSILRRVHLPSGVVVHAGTQDELWVAGMDNVGVPYVARYIVERAAPGGSIP